MVHKIMQLAALVLVGVVLMQGVTLANERGYTKTIIEKLLPGVYINHSGPVGSGADIIPPVPPDMPPPPPD